MSTEQSTHPDWVAVQPWRLPVDEPVCAGHEEVEDVMDGEVDRLLERIDADLSEKFARDRRGRRRDERAALRALPSRLDAAAVVGELEGEAA